MRTECLTTVILGSCERAQVSLEVSVKKLFLKLWLDRLKRRRHPHLISIINPLVHHYQSFVTLAIHLQLHASLAKFYQSLLGFAGGYR